MTTLASGSTLTAGQAITSPNGKYTLTLQADGNLVLSGPTGAAWDTGTAGKEAVRADMQADGNLVLYTAANGVVWASDTAGPGAHLVLQDDRNIVIYAADGGTVLWSPNSYLTETEKAAEGQLEAAAKAKIDADAAAAAAAAAPPAPAAPAAPAQQTYVVVRGDTLSAIAKRFYGKASEYHRIAAANNIANPDLIHPGQELVIPA